MNRNVRADGGIDVASYASTGAGSGGFRNRKGRRQPAPLKGERKTGTHQTRSPSVRPLLRKPATAVNRRGPKIACRVDRVAVHAAKADADRNHHKPDHQRSQVRSRRRIEFVCDGENQKQQQGCAVTWSRNPACSRAGKAGNVVNTPAVFSQLRVHPGGKQGGSSDRPARRRRRPPRPVRSSKATPCATEILETLRELEVTAGFRCAPEIFPAT